MLHIEKKFLCGALALSLGTAPVMADPFSGMWKEYNTAVEKDQPRTALAVLQRIQHKAEQQKSYGNLLCALLEERNTLGQLSPDSVNAADKRLEERVKGWKETDGVMATLYQTLMQRWQNAPKVDSLVASKDAAAYLKPNGAAAFKPLVQEGIDSRYFHNTLLAAIACHTNQWRALHEYYVSKGDRTAACLAAAMWLEIEGTRQLADSLINKYQDLPECGALAVRKFDYLPSDSAQQRIEWIDEALQRWPKWKENDRLRNDRQRLTQPQINAVIDKGMVTTDTDVMLSLRDLRNIKGVNVTLRRENKKAKGGYDMERKYSKAITLATDYDVTDDSLSLGRLPLGRWQCIIRDTDGKVKLAPMSLVVTDLQVLHIEQPKDKVRLVVVNAITGKPLPGAMLHIRNTNSDKEWKTVKTDTNGECLWKESQEWFAVYATNGDDNAMSPLDLYGRYAERRRKATRTYYEVYTDRAIYRPGNTVKVTLAAFTVDDNKEVKAKEDDSIEFVLRNAEYKVVERKKAVTDRYGAASAEFALPTEAKNGRWSVEVDNGATKYSSHRTTIMVENYRRPQFEVTLEKPENAYKAGDTLTVKGMVRTYSGMPVADAKVTYSVNRRMKWWRMSIDDANRELLKDTLTTDANGTFTVRMPMLLPDKASKVVPHFYDVTATVNVTNAAGESHSAELSMPVSNRKAYLDCRMADKILADSAITVTVSRRNIAGTPIEGKVEMLLDGVKQSDAEANKPYALAPNIASGEHSLMAICEGDTVKNTFVAFRRSDVRPMKYIHKWVYQSANQFPESGDSVWVQIGTSDKDVNAYYTVIANDSVIAQGVTRLNNENITRTLSYKPEYGDGISISLAWVKDGVMYDDVIKIKRPLPSNTLKMQWVTFRDRLVPGQKEQWTVNVTTPDGMPARARVMAVLYDHALDQLRKHDWQMPDMRYVYTPYAAWRMRTHGGLYGWAAQDIRYATVKNLDFTDFIANGTYYINRAYIGRPEVLIGKQTKDKAATRTRKYKSASVGCAQMEATELSSLQENPVMKTEKMLVGSIAGLSSQDEGDDEAEQNVPVRSDFADTAMFLPAVMTDEKGNATMSFTLPESVTTWRFMALAHDEAMRNATLTAEAVAQKELMVQPNMPRFLRSGDNATVQATVANLSDKAADVNTVMTILDAATEKKLLTATQKVKVAAGESAAVTFPVDAKKLAEGTYICRITAQGAGHTDGEQHYLNVLSDEEEVTKTVAYSFLEPTDTLLQFADMMPKDVQKAHLKVNYVDNPAWLMIETLPKMVKGCSKNAVSLSNAIYATRVAQSMKWSEETTDTLVSQLEKLQNKDGSFSWWEGMSGSTYMTSAVIKTLVRLNWLCGKQQDTKPLLDKAFAFMQKEVDKDVARMKERSPKVTPWIDDEYLSWLYSLALDGRKGGASADYLLKYLEQNTKNADMATKAVAAIVLNNNGKKAAARTFVEAIKQHTVYRKDVGRYFDSYRAEYSWCDYRIPTQTLAIEALRMITPQDKKTIGEMQRWLLSSKRTQEWDNAYNTVNAVHAFFGGDMAVLTPDKGSVTLADKQVTRKDATVKVKKQTDCESWAAAYVTFKQKTSNVEATATGLSIKRELLVNDVPVSEKAPRVGDRVQVRLTITADRDYDFVTVEDNRAACLEPVATLSGYRYGYYQEVKNTKTLLHFDKMAKGTHTVQMDYYVDRRGDYLAGTATVACAYANEFRGTTTAYSVSIEND